jgi:Flp pilus assembly protein TadB
MRSGNGPVVIFLTMVLVMAVFLGVELAENRWLNPEIGQAEAERTRAETEKLRQEYERERQAWEDYRQQTAADQERAARAAETEAEVRRAQAEAIQPPLLYLSAVAAACLVALTAALVARILGGKRRQP